MTDLCIGFCPHFREVMDLNDCYFCYFKKKAKLEAQKK